MTPFCTQADLELAVGGASILVQLLDKNKDNIADASMVFQVLDAASNEMASYIQVTVDLATLSSPYPLSLVTKTADLAAFYAWRYGADGQSIPDNVLQGREAAVRWGQDVATKRAALGVVPKAGLDQVVGLRDFDEGGHGISVAGFKRGFR